MWCCQNISPQRVGEWSSRGWASGESKSMWTEDDDRLNERDDRNTTNYQINRTNRSLLMSVCILKSCCSWSLWSRSTASNPPPHWRTTERSIPVRRMTNVRGRFSIISTDRQISLKKKSDPCNIESSCSNVLDTKPDIIAEEDSRWQCDYFQISTQFQF